MCMSFWGYLCTLTDIYEGHAMVGNVRLGLPQAAGR